MENITQETLKLIKAAKAQDIGDLGKAFTQALGLVWYDLEPAAKVLVPIITPLRNEIPRVGGEGGTATNWKAITGINVNLLSAGVSEGNRNASVVTTEQNFTAAYKGLGLEDYVTFEADYAAKNFDDMKALAVQTLLWNLMIAEEKTILWGNATTGLNGGNACPTPTFSYTTANGSLSNGTYYVVCVPLTHEGYFSTGGSVAGGIPQQVVRTNVDGSQDTYGGGAGKQSAAGTATLGGGGSTQQIVCTVAAVPGAAAYAWFYGSSATNGLLTAITTVNTYTILGSETQGTQTVAQLGNTDYSTNALLFDGLISQICVMAGTSYYRSTPGYHVSLNGGTLTADNAGGIVQINTALKAFWDQYRLSPDEMIVSSQEITNMVAKVVGGGGTPLFRFVGDFSNGTQPEMTVMGGAVLGSYLNRFTMDGGHLITIRLHPNLAPGRIIFRTKKIPYPLARIQNVIQIKTRREYYQIEWPLRARKYEYGVYCDELLQNYFPPAFGIIENIGNG